MMSEWSLVGLGSGSAFQAIRPPRRLLRVKHTKRGGKADIGSLTAGICSIADVTGDGLGRLPVAKRGHG
jgi:hypothetical protein